MSPLRGRAGARGGVMGLCGSCYRGGFVLVPRNLLNYRSVGGSSSPLPPPILSGYRGSGAVSQGDREAPFGAVPVPFDQISISPL